MATDTLSIEDARRVALERPGTPGAACDEGRRAGHGAPARRGAARHHLGPGPLARAGGVRALGAIGRNAGGAGLLGPKSETFEYWSHAACVLPLEDWPAYAFKRRQRREKGKRWHVLEERDKTCNEVLARLRGEGPLTANELGGAKKGGPWWDWSETKIAAEWLLDIGELVCRERRGFARVYDLAERAIPAELLAARTGATRNAQCGWWRRRGAPWAWRRRPTWPCTTACRARWCVGCWLVRA